MPLSTAIGGVTESAKNIDVRAFAARLREQAVEKAAERSDRREASSQVAQETLRAKNDTDESEPGQTFRIIA